MVILSPSPSFFRTEQHSVLNPLTQIYYLDPQRMISVNACCRASCSFKDPWPKSAERSRFSSYFSHANCQMYF